MAKKTNQYTIRGHLIDARTKEPLAGYYVRAFDVDRLDEDDFLGEGQVSKQGRFRISYRKARFVKSIREAFEEGAGPDLMLTIYDLDKNLVYVTPERRDAARFEAYEIALALPDQSGEARLRPHLPMEKLAPGAAEARALKRLRINTVADLRAMDVAVVAAIPLASRAGLDAVKLQAIKDSALLAGVAPDQKTLTALQTIGIHTIPQLALTGPDALRDRLAQAVNQGTLAAGQVPTRAQLLAASANAGLVQRIDGQKWLAQLGLAGDSSCADCEDDCCGNPEQLSLLSKRAYIDYLLHLVHRMAENSGQSAAPLYLNLADDPCVEVPLVRLGVEVLEQALQAGDFANIDQNRLRLLMLADRLITRYALLRLARTAFGLPQLPPHLAVYDDPISGISMADALERVEALEQENGALRRCLTGQDQAATCQVEPVLSEALVRTAGVEATPEDFVRVEQALAAVPDAAVLLDLFRQPAATPYAINYRRHLIEMTCQSASELRTRYHLNFMAASGASSRCDQAILTLQEMLRCGDAYYIYCCTQRPEDGEIVESRVEIGTKFKTYAEYRQWVQGLLWPEIFYDLHLKTPLVRGNVAALKEQLDAAEAALTAVTQRDGNDDTVLSIMGLFKQGLDTIRNLLEIDELIVRGHTAHRDEEFGLALAWYRQAQGLIRKHVQTYHAAQLATYDELFYGVTERCADGETLVTDAANLLERLATATLRPAFVRNLLSPDRVAPLAAASDWWPEGLLPTGDDIQDLLDEMLQDPELLQWVYLLGSGNPVAGFTSWLFAKKLFRPESELTNLRSTYGNAGWQVHDVADGRRFNLPFIHRENFDLDDFRNTLGPELDRMVARIVDLAFAEISNTLQPLFDGISDTINNLQADLEALWGTQAITPLEAITRIPQTLLIIATHASSIAGILDQELLDEIIAGCTSQGQNLVDPACVITAIVNRARTELEQNLGVDLSSANTFLASLDDVPAAVADKINQAITQELNRASNLAGAVNDFQRALVDYLIENAVVEDQSIWIGRDGAIREVSNLFKAEDIRNAARFKRGTLLLDKGAIGAETFTDYTAKFKLSTRDNDDLGVVFRVSEDESGDYSYYLLTIRSGLHEVTQHAGEQSVMRTAWSVLATAYAPLMADSPEDVIKLLFTIFHNPVFLSAFAGAIAADPVWNTRFPQDQPGPFVRLLKIRPGSAPQLIPAENQQNLEIKLNQDYVINLQLSDRGENGLAIDITLSEPEGDPLAEYNWTDADPLGPGGVGFYAFGNNQAIFKEAVVEYFPSGSGSLGQLLFVPGAEEGQEPAFDPTPYGCRRQSSPRRLPDWVSVNADQFQIVTVRGPNDDGADEPDRDLALDAYGMEEDHQLDYRIFDPIVDRYALATLANQLSALLPHYYFFILPLSIADALHAAGDYERAKQHYDLILDLFPNEVEHHTVTSGANGSTTVRYADPQAGIKYAFLHADLYLQTEPWQRGVEMALLKARHAANFLAAGEAGYALDTPESRQRAYEWFSQVLLSYGRTSCCAGWGGQVFCLPGAAVLDSDGADGTPGFGIDNLPPECRQNLAAIYRYLSQLPSSDPMRGFEILKLLQEIILRFHDDVEGLCQYLAAAVATLEGSQTDGDSQTDPCPDLSDQLTILERWLTRSQLAQFRIERAKIEADRSLTPEQRCQQLESLRQRWALTIRRSGIQPGSMPAAGIPATAGTVAAVDAFAARAWPVSAQVASHALSSFPGIIAGVPAPSIPAQMQPTLPVPTRCQEVVVGCLDARDLALLFAVRRKYPCVPMNPLQQIHLYKACMYLDNLNDGLDILGLREDQVSIYRYEYLLGLARSFAQFAIGAEKDFIAFRDKLTTGQLSVMQQEHALDLLGAQARIKALNREQAAVQTETAQYQIDRTATADGHLDDLLGLNDIAMGLAVISGIVGVSSGLLSLAGSAVGAVAAPATGGLSLLGTGLGLAGSAASVGSSVVGTAQSVFNVYQQRVQLQQSQELLRNYDLPIAHLNERSAQLSQQMANQQLRIGQSEARFAETVMTYISGQFLNTEMHSFLARQSKQNYRQYLAYATRAARLAEQALERQRGQAFNIVKTNYFDISVQGLLGGEALQQDIETLEYQRFTRDERKQYPPAKLYSLAARFPLEFHNFRQTGQLLFRTDHLDFDVDFPGHYHRQIRLVRVNVLALIGPQGIKASLTRLGPSQIVARRSDHFAIEALPGTIERVALNRAPDGFGLVPTNPEQAHRNPFEGSGVACWWLLEMPPHANSFDYRTIADVEFLVEYTAFDDPAYQATVKQKLHARSMHSSRAFRFRFDFPDQFYHLLNPSLTGPQYTSSVAMNLNMVAVDTAPGDYPQNEQERTLSGLHFALFDKEGKPIPLSQVFLASQRDIEALWQAGGLKVEDDPTNPPLEVNQIRVIRDGELLRIPNSDLAAGENPLADGLWKRVIRGDRMVWVHETVVRSDDAIVTDFTVTPLPRVIPAELVRQARQPLTLLLDPDSNAATHIFELKAEDSSIGLDLVDRWYLIMAPAGNPGLTNQNLVGGHQVLNLSATEEILFLLNYVCNLKMN